MISNDTTAEARQVQIELYRKMPPEKKLDLVFDAYRTGQAIAMAGIRMQHPEATEGQVWHMWAKKHLGEDLYNKVYGGRKSE